jgi:putative ABC transport system permease protein
MKLPKLKALRQKLDFDLPLAWRQLSFNRMRLFVALCGISFADILIFSQLGLSAILYDGVTRIHEHLQGDLFLSAKGAKYLGDDTFNRSRIYQAAAVEGVAAASPFYYNDVRWINPWDKKQTSRISIIAFNPVQPVLNLSQVNRQLDRITIADRFLFDTKSSDKLGAVVEKLQQGKTVTTEITKGKNRKITIVGAYTLGSSFVREGHLVTSDWNYVRVFGKESIEQVHLGVISLKPGTNLVRVQQTIAARLPKDVQVMTKEELIAAEKKYWSEDPSGIVLDFGAMMGFIVGVIVVYQILFTDVTDHLTEYATLKAMGYADRQLLLVVFQEAIILAILGFLPGFGCSLWIYGVLGDLTKIPLVMRTDVVIKVFILTISMCLISAAIAMRKLQSADPADIFR